MPSALPRNIALKLEQTLAQWQHWHGEPVPGKAPQIVEILTGGISNYSIKVGSEQEFVVRIDGINPSRIGLNRQGEYRILQDAHRAGLAPCARYYNPELGSLVCDYLPADKESIQPVSAIAALLRGIHALPHRRLRLDHAERALRYEKIIARKDHKMPIDQLTSRTQMLQLLAHLNTQGSDAPVLCHHDLLAANRLSSGGHLWAIDWEYAAMGNRWYDLAVTMVGDALNEEQSKLLVAHYLDREATEQEWLQLQGWSCIYRYLELLWYLADDATDFPLERLNEMSAALSEQLSLLNVLGD